MFGYCYQSRTEVDMLKENIEEMKKQISNIYELLEVLTNESKRKCLNVNDSNDDIPKENYGTSKTTFFIDQTSS